jgi:hypothetical protein
MMALIGNSKPSEEEVGSPDRGGLFMQSKLFAALFYGISSILVVFTNKWIMTSFHFPYFKFLAAVQFVTTAAILLLLAVCKKVDIPFFSLSICREILPISFMFLGNVLCGLGSTQNLSIPMFTALRRFSILMTMGMEYFVLSNKPSNQTLLSVFLMVGGAMIGMTYVLCSMLYSL